MITDACPTESPTSLHPTNPGPRQGRPGHKSLLVAGHRIAYLDEGSGPPVLLIHGIPTSSLLWREIIPVLAETHRVIAPDMLNYGKSDKPADADVSIAAQSRLMVGVLDALGVSRADVEAHDIGGGVAQLMAMPVPGRSSGT